MATNIFRLTEAKVPALGMFVLSSDPFVMEAIATLPLDWIAFDMEASSTNRKDLLNFVLATKGEQAVPLVRLQNKEQFTIEQALDLGVAGIIAPKVNTAEDAFSVSAACRYPPRGTRGVNPVRASRYFDTTENYFKTANDEVLCIVQIESAEALNNVEAIAGIKEINGLFVGCGDLAMSLGTPGDMESGEMKRAIERIVTVCQQHNKMPGIFAYSARLANVYLKMGYRLVAIGNDIKALKTGASLWLLEINLGKI